MEEVQGLLCKAKIIRLLHPRVSQDIAKVLYSPEPDQYCHLKIGTQVDLPAPTLHALYFQAIFPTGRAMIFEVDPSLKDLFDPKAPFESAAALSGQVHRELEQRRTLSFENNSLRYFIKIHFGTTWPEILKNFLQLKRPVLGARNEWFALHHLKENGVKTADPLVYFDNLTFPTHRKSFIVMSAVTDFITLEDLAKQGHWRELNFHRRRLLLQAVARLARKMHSSGIQHRDFYICHILLPLSWLTSGEQSPPELTLIDLHRAIHTSYMGSRRLRKDLAALLFSSMADAELTTRDLVYFMRQYDSRPIKSRLSFWRAVARRAKRLNRKLTRINSTL